MELIHGRATIKLDGNTVVSEEDATLKIGGLKNNVRNINGKNFRSQSYSSAEVSFKTPITKSVSLRTLQEMAGKEVQFVSDTGVTWIVPDAAQTNELGTGGDGMADILMVGDSAVDQS